MRDYILRICLDSPLYLKFIDFQAKKKLGKTYAGLLIFLEGMKSLGLIDKETYEFYKNRYDKPLEASPIKVEVIKPKCFLCGREAVTYAVSVQTGKKKPVCQKHAIELEKHPKWKVEEKSIP